ncbi:MAG: hypothetical protein DRN05_00260 [Thermoplasmata archaeon]|nr:MAG: hypothetical protein DRN05_00260 [Thermoplasmata archaeon]
MKTVAITRPLDIETKTCKTNKKIVTSRKTIKKNRKNISSKQKNLYEICIKKGLIEKTPYGYIFKPEFFETLKIYED